MDIVYSVNIPDPRNHKLKVRMKGKCKGEKLCFSLPVWSPGSYLVREYSKNIIHLKLSNEKGVNVPLVQVRKNWWEGDFSGVDSKEFELEYEIYCHETSVRTSYIDESHAFLHGPSIFMGIEGESFKKIEVKIDIPKIWSKITTGLKDISEKREEFKYAADSYDQLLDCPIELGCQETDGFYFKERPHELAFYGKQLPHKNNLKKDIEVIVEHVSSYFSDIPYDKYVFITHFLPENYGGLEHENSTALQFDGTVLGVRKDYLSWLALVAHEYFHTWNVKRIRPKALGPFDYNNENYTSMLWLAEGLTSYMDDLMVFRAGLSSFEEYLNIVKRSLNMYLSIPGKYFHSLEQSSFNAWVKLYRPDENIRNTSISYYLKGALVFMALDLELYKYKKGMVDFISLLWDSYKKNPNVGLTSEEVFSFVEKLSDKELRNKFEMMVQSTEDIDFKSLFKRAGLELVFKEKKLSFGICTNVDGDKLSIASVTLDGAAYKNGLNAGDEIIAIEGIRTSESRFKSYEEELLENKKYRFLISRRNIIHEIDVLPELGQEEISEIKINDEKLALSIFKDFR